MAVACAKQLIGPQQGAQVFLTLLQSLHCNDVRLTYALVGHLFRGSFHQAGRVLGIVDKAQLALQQREEPLAFGKHGLRDTHHPVVPLQPAPYALHAPRVLLHELVEAEMEPCHLAAAYVPQVGIVAAVEVYHHIVLTGKALQLPADDAAAHGLQCCLVPELQRQWQLLAYLALRQARQSRAADEMHHPDIMRNTVAKHLQLAHVGGYGQRQTVASALRKVAQILHQHRVDAPVKKPAEQKQQPRLGAV